MPWPLREDLVLSSFPKLKDVEKHGWNQPDVSMITMCKKRPEYAVYEHMGWWKYNPIPDGKLTDERLDDIWAARDVVLAMMSREGNRLTVVHCLAGRNRSALVAGLAMQYIYNWTGPQTLTFLRDRRPRSIHNDDFEEFLNSLGRPRLT